MTDLEIVKKCAEKMGHKWNDNWKAVVRDDGSCWLYHPLTDDAQAMALVKEFELNIGPTAYGWQVSAYDGSNETDNKDLNRAICECVARLPGFEKQVDPNKWAFDRGLESF